MSGHCVYPFGDTSKYLAPIISFPRHQVPVLVLEAGQDGMVRSDGIEQFRRRAPKTVSVRYRLFEGAYHDLFDETDDIRQAGRREARVLAARVIGCRWWLWGIMDGDDCSTERSSKEKTILCQRPLSNGR